MLRLLGIRSVIALVVLFAAVGGIYAIRDRMASLWPTQQRRDPVEDERDWRQRELVFLKQVYDRLEAQRRADGGNAPSSVSGEQQAILQRMAETAAPIRSDVPAEVRALLPDTPTPEPEEPKPQATPQAAADAPLPMAGPVELRLSSAALPGIGTDLASLAPDPELDRIWDRVSSLRARQPKQPESATKPAASETGGSAKP